MFDRVLADIGDDQSIAESLSTFSAHVRRLIAIMEATGPRSLVLLDEPAAGTDPDEGSRLAQAVIERLVEQGALVAGHDPPPRGEGVGQRARRGAANAAVGVDMRTLRPLYTLKLGEPGASHALGIAEGLGLDPAVVEAARAGPGRPSAARSRRCSATRRPPAPRPTTSARRRAARAAAEEAERAGAEAAAGRELERRIERSREAAEAERAAARERAEAELAGAHPRADRPARRDRGRPPRGGGARAEAPGGGRERARERDRRLGDASRAAARAREALRAPVPEPGADRRAGRGGRPGHRSRRWASAGRSSRSTAAAPRCRAARRGCACRSSGWGATARRPPAPSPEPPPPAPRAAGGPPASLEIDVRGRRADETRATVRERIDAAAMAGSRWCA